MADNEVSTPNYNERRKMVLTKEDLEAIKRVTCACPHGMSAEDVYRLRDLLETYDNVKSTVGGYVIKAIAGLVVAIGILVAWITQAGNK